MPEGCRHNWVQYPPLRLNCTTCGLQKDFGDLATLREEIARAAARAAEQQREQKPAPALGEPDEPELPGETDDSAPPEEVELTRRPARRRR